MPSEYNWHPGVPNKSVFKVETRNLGWWVLLAILISVAVHVTLYVVLGTIERRADELEGEHIVWRSKHEQVTIDRDKLNELLADPVIPENTDIKPEKVSDLDLTDKTLDEFDLMEKLKDEPIRMSPVSSPQVFSTEAPKAPSQTLEVAANQLDISASEILSQDLAAMRNKLVESSAAVSVSQPVLELNAGGDEVGSGVDTDEFFKEAAAKAFGNGADEFVKGYSSLDDLIGRTGGLPPGEEKIALPTDILFGYNEHQLKEEARLSMMKLAFVVQTNPDAVFVIEGHTDSFGGDQFNLDLSLKRAEAVRDWLIERLRIDASNIRVVGLGKTRPIVPTTGDADQQSLNRRVEIVVKKP
ncbi:MAG TPA: OmpA family protein [Bacteroidia bacterium]|nr:OmpA family protein [Bacteroidia bacterium]